MATRSEIIRSSVKVLKEAGLTPQETLVQNTSRPAFLDTLGQIQANSQVKKRPNVAPHVNVKGNPVKKASRSEIIRTAIKTLKKTE